MSKTARTLHLALSYDAAIMDVMLPKLDGLSIIESMAEPGRSGTQENYWTAGQARVSGDLFLSGLSLPDRILTLLNSIMDISEAETGIMRLKLETVDLTKLMREMLDLYQYVAENNNIVVSLAALKTSA